MRKLISLITLFSFSIQAATITDDKLTVGKKASASAKEIVFDTNDGANNKKLSVDKITKKLSATSDEVIVGDGTASDKALTFNRGGSNAQVKWNELTDKLQFSNDGTTFKDLGTGGGGGGSTGVNVLTNDSFEDAVGGVITDWSNTGGTLTQVSYTNSVEGDAKYFQFVATTSGQYFEMVKTVPTNFNGQGCQVDFKKLNIATADLFKVEALDASNNVLATGNVKVSSWQKFPTLSFVCPAAGSTFKIRVTSLAAGTLQGDKAYLGSNQNLVGINVQEQMVEFSDSTGFGSTETTTRRFTNLQKQNGQGLFTTNFASQGVNGLQITLVKDSIVEGEYCDQGNTQGQMGVTVNVNGATNINSGITYASGLRAKITPATDYACAPFTFKALSGEVIRFQVGAASNFVASSINTKVSFKASTPVDSIAVNPEQASWFIDANIGGQNPNLGIGNQSSYIEIPGTTLDLVNNTAKGSAPVEIACANGFASIGNNCGANNETIGIAFVPGAGSGLYEACFSFSHNANSANGMTSYFQVVETSNTSSAILAEGGQRIGGGHGNAISVIYPQKVCGTFNFSDVSKKTIRLMYEQNASSGNASSVFADRDANNGQRDISVTVRPLLSAFNRPILTSDQVTQKGVLNPKIKTAKYSAGSCSNIVGVGESWITPNSGTNLGTQCAWNIIGFSVAPVCFALPQAANAIANKGGSVTTSSILQLRTLDAAGLTSQDTNADITCIGY